MDYRSYARTAGRCSYLAMPCSIRLFHHQHVLMFSTMILIMAEQEEDVVDLLSKDFEDEGRYHRMKNQDATTWLISFEQMLGRDALVVNYFSSMACIEPTDIPQSMLPAGKKSASR